MKVKLSAILVLGCMLFQASGASPETVKQLNAMMQGEYATNHRYGAFAQKATEEGLTPEAALFRAAARAEGIHRSAMRAAMQTMNLEPSEPTPDDLKPASTRENLQTSILSENAEAKVIYPRLLKQLGTETNSVQAIRIIEYAIASEAQHSRLFQEALAHLGENKTNAYYICPQCSLLSLEKPSEACQNCQGRANPILLRAPK
ncbi:MAG: ferritin family protein [Verrucomicrobiota bacterium]